MEVKTRQATFLEYGNHILHLQCTRMTEAIYRECTLVRSVYLASSSSLASSGSKQRGSSLASRVFLTLGIGIPDLCLDRTQPGDVS